MDAARLKMTVDTSDVDRAKRKTREFAGETRKAGRQVKNSTSAMAAAFKRPVVAIAAVTAALATIGPAISVLRTFESSMSQVGAISRATATELGLMRDVAKDLGSTTEFTAAQAADGMRFLAMAGFSAAESITAIPQILDLATASSMDLAMAADIASNIMSAFAISAGDAGDVADVLFATSSRANTSVEQLGEAMKFVGPVAKAMGVSMNDAAAAVGVLSDNGLQGSLAGTGLRRVLSSLVNPTTQAADALNKMGVSLEDVNPTTNELTDIVDTLAEAGISAADALTIFGDRGGPAILALVGNNARLRQLTAEVQNVDGAAGEAATTLRDNLGGDIDSLGSAVQGLIISLGDAGLTAILRGLIQAVTAVARGITGLVDAIAGIPEGIAKLLGLESAQTQLAQAAGQAKIAMDEEMQALSDLTAGAEGSRKVSQIVALQKLNEAEARRENVRQMQAEARSRVIDSEPYQAVVDRIIDITANLENMRGGLIDVDNMAQSVRASYDEQEQSLIAAYNQQSALLDLIPDTSAEYAEAEAVVDDLRQRIEESEGGMVDLGDASRNTTAEVANLRTEMNEALLAARGLASALPGGRSGGAGGRMVGGPRFKRQTIQEQADAMDPEAGGGGGLGGGSRISDAEQAKMQAAAEITRLVQSQWTEQQKLNFELERYRGLMDAGTINTDQFGQAQTVLQQKMAEAKWSDTQQKIESLGMGLAQAAMNGENLGEALVRMLGQMAIEWLVAAAAAKAADVLSGGILSASMGAGGGIGGGVLDLIGFANGTNNAPGGMAMVGERGPELVNLPKGSQVIPNDRVGNRMRQMAPQVSVAPAPVQVVVLDDPRKIDQYRMSPEGERARSMADKRMR